MGIQAGDIVDRERDFFNEQGERYLWMRAWIWRAIGEFNRNSELADLYNPRGKRVLLYGCGPASEAERFVQAGAAHVAGIDISDSEIAQAWRTAHEGGYDDRVDFRAGDAHAMEFPDDSFDLIVGSAILHHLDVPRALAELRRVLAPEGRAVFLEPLAHNPLLRLGRRLTPSARTADEHPFTVEDWQLCAEVFPAFWHREVELTSIPLMPLNLVLPRSWRIALARRVRGLDDALLARYPQLGRFARSTFLVLE